MEFNIYTTGSAEFLEIMLNASAMITGSGTSEDLARIGLLIGIIFLAFQAVWNGQGISFQRAGLLFVLYLIFYGPTATTVIEDTTSGQVRVVDNVPLGPAFVGSVISTVAYEITRVSEQAFSTPTMTDYGLFSSLTTITAVRDALRNPESLDSFVNYRKAEGWNLPKQLEEYLAFCAANPVALRNHQSINDLYRAAGIENMGMPMQAQWIYAYRGGPSGEMLSCSEAKPIINAAMKEVVLDVMDDILNRGFALQKASGRMTNGTDVQNRLTEAIQSFAISGKEAQSFVEMSLIGPVFGEARVTALNHWHQRNSALALREALNHQEIQWAGKGDLFKHYMRPMIGFFEGLLYAMTPFMAFALVLGGPGLSIMGKYMVLPLAVGLWMPLLAIVNAFTLWYAGAEMEAIFNSYDSVESGFSLLQLLDIDQAVSKALGIGGLLAASVPPLALFIVSGSAMVLNSVVGQTTQADKFKSEDVMPRTKEQAPVLTTTSGHTSDNIGYGTSRTGTLQTLENISGEEMSAAMVQSSHSAAQTASTQYQESLKAAGQQMSSTSTGRQAMAQIGENLAAGSVLSQNANYSDARETMRSLGISESSLNQATANAALGISTPFGGLQRADGTTTASMTKEDQASAEKALAQLTSSIQATDSSTLTFATGDAFSNSALAQQSATNSDEIAQNKATALQKQDQYMEAVSQQGSIKAGQSLNLRDFAAQSISNSGLGKFETSWALFNKAGETERGRELFNKAYKDLEGASGDTDERRAMAAIRAMNQDGRLGEIMDSNFNPLSISPSVGDARANAGVMAAANEATAGADAIGGRFDAKWSSNAGAYASTNDMNVSGYQATKEDGATAIDQRNAENLKPVIEASTANSEAIDNRSSQAAYDTLAKRGEAARQGSNLGKVVAEGANSAFTGFDTIARAFRSSSDSEKLDNYYDIGISQGLKPEEAQYFAAKATGEFGQSQGDAYRELNSYYRSQGIRDDNYIAGAITAIDDAAKAPESGSYPALTALAASRDAVQYQAYQGPSNEDVPQVPTQAPAPQPARSVPPPAPSPSSGEPANLKPQRPTGFNAD